MINFLPLTENDLLLLYQWFQKSHIKKWYARGQHFSLEMIKEKYTPRINNSKIPNFIIYADSIPIGYIQFYHVSQFLPDEIDSYNHSIFDQYDPQQLAGIDLFLAEEKYLHKGYGSKMIKDFIENHLRGKFSAVLVDPQKENEIALSFFTKNGFKQIQASHDAEHIIMILPLRF